MDGRDSESTDKHEPLPRPRRRRLWLVITAALIAMGAVAFVMRGHFLPEWAPVGRGARLAGRAGCLACHSNGAFDGVANPAAGPGTASAGVPALFDAGLRADDIRRWIESGSAGMTAGRPTRPSGILPMPAYGGVLDADDIDDLVAWVVAMQRPREVPAPEALARRSGCFACHGELGQGGVGNPDSQKGYIPGFFGKDFDILTRGRRRDVVREWIHDGISKTFVDEVAFGLDLPRRVLEGQAIRMPAYGAVLDDADIETLTDLVLDLATWGPMDAARIGEWRAAALAAGRGATDASRTDSLAPAAVRRPIDFSRDIAPLLARSCVGCHGPEKQKSDYRLDNETAAYTAGRIASDRGWNPLVKSDPTNSLLVIYVKCTLADDERDLYPMPPEESDRLTSAEIALLETWIAQGAPWPAGVVLEAPPK